MISTRIAALMFAGLLVLGGCSKKEEAAPQAAKQPSSPAAEMPASHPPTGPAASTQAPPERHVVVPDDVRSAWKAVVLQITDLTTNQSQDLTIDIGGSGTQGDLEISVDAFLPAFTMTENTITSRSVETENPAARLVAREKGVEIFSGWLFSLYPDAHPFTHERYGVVLKDFVKKN